MRALVVVSFAALCSAFALPAIAQPRDPAGAEVLYRAGRDAAKRGDWPTACAKLAESQRLDPAPGTLLNLADCEEHRGQLALAWQHFVQAQGALPRGDSRATYAKGRADAVDKRVPRLTVRLGEGAPIGMHVLRDEQELGAPSLGVALPVDPGEHVVVGRADGRADSRATVTLAEGESREVMVVPGPAATTAPVDTPPPYVGARPPEPATPSSSAPPPPLVVPEKRPVYGYALLGAGAVGIATGTVTGILALSRAGTVKDACGPNYTTCTSASVDAAHDGKLFTMVSTVGFVAGAVLAGAGLYFLLTPPSSSTGGAKAAISVAPTPTGGQAALSGTF